MFYIGTQYFRAPTPSPEHWESDIRQAKAYGLDYFRFWLMWSWYSQYEGKFDFSSLKRLLDLCTKHGMKAIMLVNLESVPAWLVRKHPEAVYRDAKGGLYMPESVGNTPAGGFPGLCFHHQEIVTHGKAYIAALAKTFKDHPAIECWEPHNEPMFEPGRYNDNFYCYCERSIEQFQHHLKKKYGVIDALNRVWRRNYGCFEEVQPPRRRGMYNDWLDWRTFAVDHLIATLSWRIETIRANDPNHYVMIHTRGGSGVTRNLAKEGIDDFRMAALVDKYGTAAFPQCGPEHEYFIAMTGARCAAKGKEFWMAELQAGPYGMGVHRNDAEPVCELCGSATMEATIDRKEGVFDPGEVTAERLAMWSWSGIAQGAKGVLYWQYRNESFGLEYGFGLTNLDGTPHARLGAVKKFHDILDKNSDLFDRAVLPENEIALAWDPSNDIINWTAVGCADAVKNSIKGMHKALWHLDYPIDIVRLDTGVVDEDFSKYRILYLPFSPRITESSVKKLTAFVHSGGTLIAEGSLAQFDDSMGVSPVVPGNGLDELFGCRRRDIRTMPRELIPALKMGTYTMKTLMHKEILTPSAGARIAGRFSSGEIAAVENRCGKGTALYLGTNPFMRYAIEDVPNLRKWLLTVNKNIQRHCYSNVPDVVARALLCDGKKLVFLLNTRDRPAQVTLTIPGAGKKTKKIGELTKGERVSFTAGARSVSITRNAGPYEVAVYVVE